MFEKVNLNRDQIKKKQTDLELNGLCLACYFISGLEHSLTFLRPIQFF